MKEATEVFETIEDKLKHERSWPIISNRWLCNALTDYFRLVSIEIIFRKVDAFLQKIDALFARSDALSSFFETK